MDMRPVRMGGNDKSVIAFGKTHGSFIADLICFLRCDLPRLKGLADLVGNDVTFRFSSGCPEIFLLRQHEFFICCFGVACICGNVFSVLCLLSVLSIIRPVFQAPCHGFSLIYMHCDQSGCCHAFPISFPGSFIAGAGYISDL